MYKSFVQAENQTFAGANKTKSKKLAQFSFPPSEDVSKTKQQMSDCQLLSELPEGIEVDGARGGNDEQAMKTLKMKTMKTFWEYASLLFLSYLQSQLQHADQ